MPETPLPSREQWNTPHSPEFAWDIAAEMTPLDRRRIAAAWLSGELMTAEEAQRKKNTDNREVALQHLSKWEAEREI